jgi:hypothetical protein
MLQLLMSAILVLDLGIPNSSKMVPIRKFDDFWG